jgi:hypothetical protein
MLLVWTQEAERKNSERQATVMSALLAFWENVRKRVLPYRGSAPVGRHVTYHLAQLQLTADQLS